MVKSERQSAEPIVTPRDLPVADEDGDRNAIRTVRLAYLISRYPAVSHTFILREIVALRSLGFEIDVASINSADRPLDQLPADECDEERNTYYVKRQGAFAAVRAIARTLFACPLGLCRGFAAALSLGGERPRFLAVHLFYFVEAVLLYCWMIDRRLRHLHIHFGTEVATVGLILARAFPVTISFTIHGPDEFYNVDTYHLKEKVKAASFVCCIGSYARSQLMKLLPREEWAKLHVAPLGVDTNVFSPRPFRENPDSFDILCVGRLVPAKGQHILINAVAKVLLQGLRVRLRLVGDGPDRADLERRVLALEIQDAVLFEGAVNQDRVRYLLEKADVFALASFAEGVPVALMEAMSMEIPCVSTRINGIPELIRDGVDGYLVAPSDENELAGALGLLLGNRELRRRVGASGRERVLARYQLQANAQRLAAILREQLDLLGVYS